MYTKDKGKFVLNKFYNGTGLLDQSSFLFLIFALWQNYDFCALNRACYIQWVSIHIVFQMWWSTIVFIPYFYRLDILVL